MIEILIGIGIAIILDKIIPEKKEKRQTAPRPKYMRKNITTYNLEDFLTKTSMTNKMEKAIQSYASEYDIAWWEQLHHRIQIEQGEWVIHLPTAEGETEIRIDKTATDQD